jgi:hypothetical protein
VNHAALFTIFAAIAGGLLACDKGTEAPLLSVESAVALAPAPAAAALKTAPTAQAAHSAPSPETLRLEARRQLYESVDALVQASEFEKARRLLDDDVQRYGDELAPEWQDLQQSYRLMADCLEQPSPKLRMRAEAFVMVSQAAFLKERILKACGGAKR